MAKKISKSKQIKEITRQRKDKSRGRWWNVILGLFVALLAVLVSLTIKIEDDEVGDLTDKEMATQEIEAYLSKYISYSQKGDIEQMKGIEKLVRHSNFIPLFPVLARGWMNIRYEYSQTAVNYLLEFLKKYPEHADKELLLNLGYLSMELGEKPQAENAFRAALQKSNTDTVAMIALSESLRGRGESKDNEADLLLEKALKSGDRQALAFKTMQSNSGSATDSRPFPNSYEGFVPKSSDDIEFLSLPIEKNEEALQILEAKLMDCVKKRKPLVVKGVIDLFWPNLSNWKSDNYLDRWAGNEYVYAMADDRKKLKGFWSQRRLMRFKDFLKDSEHFYLTSQKRIGNSSFQPPINNRLKKDLPIPSFLNNLSIKTINFWYGLHNKISRLHHDDYENLAVIIQGNKRYIMCSPREASKMGVIGAVKQVTRNGKIMYETSESSNGEHFCVRDLYASIPENCLDVTVEGGGMIYIPGGWFHQVKSVGNPQHKAVNIWWDFF